MLKPVLQGPNLALIFCSGTFSYLFYLFFFAQLGLLVAPCKATTLLTSSDYRSEPAQEKWFKSCHDVRIFG